MRTAEQLLLLAAHHFGETRVTGDGPALDNDGHAIDVFIEQPSVPLFALFEQRERSFAIGDIEGGTEDGWPPVELDRRSGELTPAFVAAFCDEHELVMGGLGFSTLTSKAPLLHHFPVIRMNEFPEAHREELVARVTRHGLASVVDVTKHVVLDDEDCGSNRLCQDFKV